LAVFVVASFYRRGYFHRVFGYGIAGCEKAIAA